MPQVTMINACKDFFGLKPDQTGMQFGSEFLKLNNEDRKEIAQGLIAQGYQIDPTTIERKA